MTYRFDWLAQKFKVPLVPYFKGGMTYSVWWVTNGSGEIANTYDLEGEGRAGYGGTFGLHVGGGLQFLLDWFGAGMAAEFDSEIGVNNSYIFFEYAYHSVNDFGSETSFDLGDANFSAGLMFESLALGCLPKQPAATFACSFSTTERSSVGGSTSMRFVRFKVT